MSKLGSLLDAGLSIRKSICEVSGINFALCESKSFNLPFYQIGGKLVSVICVAMLVRVAFHLLAFSIGIIFTNPVWAQSNEGRLAIQLGPVFNQSSDAFNNTTGLGMFLQADYFPKENIRVALGVEPTALVYGVLVLPGGCEHEHRRYPGVPSCREGSNYLLNNFVSGDLFWGKSSYGKKGGLRQAYVGLSANMLAHQRYVITSRVIGQWRDTRLSVSSLSMGGRLGYLLGRMDLSVSYNQPISNFRGFVGFRLGYIPFRWQLQPDG